MRERLALMDNYLLLKLLHILSATVLMGTGAGIAFFMLMASRSENFAAISLTAKHVILADWVFTTPAVLVQCITGVMLMQILGYSYSSIWFFWVASVFTLIGLCWLPVIYIQYRLKQCAETVLEDESALTHFRRWMGLWVMLGIPAFLAMLVVFWLMIFKPFPVQ